MKLKLIMLLLTASLVAMADECLVIHLKSGNGRQLIYALANEPVITFEGNNMLVFDTKMNSTSTFPLADIAYYELVNGSVDIQQVQSDDAKPVIAQGHVVFSQLSSGSKVSVYTVDGQLIRNYMADLSGNVDVNLTNFSKGVYVINSPFTTIIVTNR